MNAASVLSTDLTAKDNYLLVAQITLTRSDHGFTSFLLFLRFAAFISSVCQID